jgi:hypothetical protein
MLAHVLHRIVRVAHNLAQQLERRLLAATKPAAPGVVAGTLATLRGASLPWWPRMRCYVNNSSSCDGVSSVRAAPRLTVRSLSC